MMQNKIYVGNFPYTVDEAQLRGIFSGYGDIEECTLIMDRDTGRPKGFGFITFAKQEGYLLLAVIGGRGASPSELDFEST